jgi:hypothetical protein
MDRLAGFKYRRADLPSIAISFNRTTNRYTTVPNHPGDMPEGTLRAVLKQADVEPDKFLNA